MIEQLTLQDKVRLLKLPRTHLNPEILAKLRRLFYELPRNFVTHCDAFNLEGTIFKITRHESRRDAFTISGPGKTGIIEIVDPGTYQGLYIVNVLLNEITQDATDEGLQRIRTLVAQRIRSAGLPYWGY